MTLTIEIAPEIEYRLEAEAKRSGVSKSDLAKNVIEERFGSKEDKRQNYLPEGFTPRYIGKAENTRDFSGDDEWLRENRENYQGKYVATHGNRLIASGDKLKEVIGRAREVGLPDSLLTYVVSRLIRRRMSEAVGNELSVKLCCQTYLRFDQNWNHNKNHVAKK